MSDYLYPLDRHVVFENAWGSIGSAKVMRHDGIDDDTGELLYALIDSDDYVHYVPENEIMRLDKELNDYQDRIWGLLS